MLVLLLLPVLLLLGYCGCSDVIFWLLSPPLLVLSTLSLSLPFLPLLFFVHRMVVWHLFKAVVLPRVLPSLPPVLCRRTLLRCVTLLWCYSIFFIFDKCHSTCRHPDIIFFVLFCFLSCACVLLFFSLSLFLFFLFFFFVHSLVVWHLLTAVVPPSLPLVLCRRTLLRCVTLLWCYPIFFYF